MFFLYILEQGYLRTDILMIIVCWFQRNMSNKNRQKCILNPNNWLIIEIYTKLLSPFSNISYIEKHNNIKWKLLRYISRYDEWRLTFIGYFLIVTYNVCTFIKHFPSESCILCARVHRGMYFTTMVLSDGYVLVLLLRQGVRGYMPP